MRGIDSNILLRWLLDESIIPDDAQDQTNLVADLILNSRTPFVANHIVIAETIWVLRNRAGRSKPVIREVVERLLNSINVVVPDREVVESALRSFVAHPGDFADHLIGEINKNLGCETTLTFDKAASKSPLFSQLKR